MPYKVGDVIQAGWFVIRLEEEINGTIVYVSNGVATDHFFYYRPIECIRPHKCAE